MPRYKVLFSWKEKTSTGVRTGVMQKVYEIHAKPMNGPQWENTKRGWIAEFTTEYDIKSEVKILHVKELPGA